MIYFTNPTGSPAVHEAIRNGTLGFIATPAQGNARIANVTWCADNGCYGKGYPGDSAWLRWLEKHAVDANTCSFATAPDVVGDAKATLARSMPMLPIIREFGYDAALVAQDGLEAHNVPWEAFDVLFIGGSTEWKLGEHALKLVREAHWYGKGVHMGRVNSHRRYKYAKHIGCDSVDGTYLTYGPDKLLPNLLKWVSG